ncbi:DUF7695 domain-containing protein [Paenibacillus harenae]|uniref:DUF7695 domain-containing protein n=1 Tax=Paenibacillus harenae TaxID=306543 RepID=UPI00278ED182|nr:hypothetical protein [Paenibacillus harenae]MDQ0057866.1 Zn finger protein HypA/HybF involved in hydrogenase expression [Paenibacillus harenae]
MKIIRNAIRCKHCHNEVSSEDKNDFRICKCGKVGVDGGYDYLRRIGSLDDYEELSEWK